MERGGVKSWGMLEVTMKELLRLRLGLSEDPRMKEFAALEAALEENPKVQALSLEMKKKADAYEEATRFGEDSPLAKAAQHELYLAKKALDECEEVRAYQRAYSAIRQIYEAIDEILYGEYRFPVSCGGHHA